MWGGVVDGFYQTYALMYAPLSDRDAATSTTSDAAASATGTGTSTSTADDGPAATTTTSSTSTAASASGSGMVQKREDYISWDDYFMGVAFLSAMRSKDPSTQVGACLVDGENKIVGIGT